MPDCIFCKIIKGEAFGEILYQDDEVLVFKDIKPASKHHFLAIPIQHIPNVNYLTADNFEIVSKLIAKGQDVVSAQGGDLNDLRVGFHLPPFNSVSHLHLHLITPESEMSFLSRLVFRPNSYWFGTPEQVLAKLSKL